MKGVCTGFLAVVQPFFNFTASKYVLIKDWRLGVILRCLQMGILIYVLTDIFQKAAYLNVEVPSGSFTVRPNGLIYREKIEDFEKQRKAVNGSNPVEYCANPDKYHFHREGVHYEDFKCAYLESSSIFVNGESQVFVTTSMRIEKLHYYPMNARMQCPQIGKGRQIGNASNVCLFNEEQSYFPIKPEDIILHIVHGYRTSSMIDKRGTLPETIVKAHDFSSKEIRFGKGTLVTLSLSQLLEVAGVDLDQTLDKQENNPCQDPSQGSKGNFNEEDHEEARNGETVAYPYARLSGLTLQLTFNYYTRRLAPNPFNKPTGDNSDDVVCIVEIVPVNRWSPLGSEIRQMMNKASDPIFLTTDEVDVTANDTSSADPIASQTDFQRNGVVIVFDTSGSVGRFELSSLIDALVAGSVLMAVAQIITTYVAQFALGISSELYTAFMKETVNWRQEYARYAAQACVAGFAFEYYDKNNSGKLDRKEIFDVLNSLMVKDRENDEERPRETNDGDEEGENFKKHAGKMDSWKLAALADFLMRQGDADDRVSKGRFNASERMVETYIDIYEWIDIFTEDKANWPALSRLIEVEYPDEISRDKVHSLLSKSITRRAKGLLDKSSINEVSAEEETDLESATPMSFSKMEESNTESDILAPLIRRKNKTIGKGAKPGSSIDRRTSF